MTTFHFQERLAIAQQLEVGRFAPEIDGDGAVSAGLASGVAHGSSSSQMVDGADDPRGGNAYPIARRRAGVEALPLNRVECGLSMAKSDRMLEVFFPNLWDTGGTLRGKKGNFPPLDTTTESV